MVKILGSVWFLMFFISVNAQSLNKEIKALIELKKSEDIFSITAKAENLSDLSRSATYELKVFKENIKTKNKGDTKQTGRFIIESKNVKELSVTSVNSTKEDKIIILLLIRDLDNNIIGRDRKVIISNVINENEFDSQKVVRKKPADGIRLKGVVLQRVKTKPGRDFYNYFYGSFLRYNFNDSRPIIIEEKFDRGRTTKIFVFIDNRKVYEFFVQPSLDYLKKQSDLTIRLVYQFFEKKEKDYIVRY